MLLHQGVDIAICAHSHTLQNFETLTDDSGHQMLVYYSLGNFISTQKEPACLLGGMADITIVRDPVSDALSIRNADFVPLVTHYNHDQNIYTVYKLRLHRGARCLPWCSCRKHRTFHSGNFTGTI